MKHRIWGKKHFPNLLFNEDSLFLFLSEESGDFLFQIYNLTKKFKLWILMYVLLTIPDLRINLLTKEVRKMKNHPSYFDPAILLYTIVDGMNLDTHNLFYCMLYYEKRKCLFNHRLVTVYSIVTKADYHKSHL